MLAQPPIEGASQRSDALADRSRREVPVQLQPLNPLLAPLVGEVLQLERPDLHIEHLQHIQIGSRGVAGVDPLAQHGGQQDQGCALNAAVATTKGSTTVRLGHEVGRQGCGELARSI